MILGVDHVAMSSVDLGTDTGRLAPLGEDDAKTALASAGAWDFVAVLPEDVHNEARKRFSGGRRQRIALARALVRKPKLLILDEPATALDPAAEQAICNTLCDLAKTTTILAISDQRALVVVAHHVHRVGPQPGIGAVIRN